MTGVEILISFLKRAGYSYPLSNFLLRNPKLFWLKRAYFIPKLQNKSGKALINNYTLYLGYKSVHNTLQACPTSYWALIILIALAFAVLCHAYCFGLSEMLCSCEVDAIYLECFPCLKQPTSPFFSTQVVMCCCWGSFPSWPCWTESAVVDQDSSWFSCLLS